MFNLNLLEMAAQIFLFCFNCSRFKDPEDKFLSICCIYQKSLSSFTAVITLLQLFNGFSFKFQFKLIQDYYVDGSDEI